MEHGFFSEDASAEEIVNTISDLASSQEESALEDLRKLLRFDLRFSGNELVAVSRLATRALLQKGKLGVEILTGAVLGSPIGENRIDVPAILEGLWHAAHGQLPPMGIQLNVDLVLPLDRPPSVDSRDAAMQAFQEIVEESQFNGDLFQKLLMFLYQAIFSLISFEDEVSPDKERAATDLMRSIVFEVFTEPAIKITSRLIVAFEILISENYSEEVYQRFLTQNPVFIDPLASEVIPKQKLGLEHVTDFVIRRLDDEYILVEIEKPQDTIFTGTNDFTARFTHAYGQVLGFQEWVDAHGEYARSLMPGIFSPKGVLIIGMRNELSAEQTAKLKRLNINSRSIEVLTYDDLIRKAKDLYQNIHRKRN
jgi:hypothetical protein